MGIMKKITGIKLFLALPLQHLIQFLVEGHPYTSNKGLLDVIFGNRNQNTVKLKLNNFT